MYHPINFKHHKSQKSCHEKPVAKTNLAAAYSMPNQHIKAAKAEAQTIVIKKNYLDNNESSALELQ